MTDLEAGSVDVEETGASRTNAPVKVFINYRRQDTEEAAVRLYERLSSEFGADNVFLDVKSLGAGTKWLEEIKAHGVGGSAFLALIGRTWTASLEGRRRLQPGDAQDFVEMELELGLSQWPGRVIPVLVGRVTMPDAGQLPKPIRALADIEAMSLRPLSFDEDVKELIAAIATTPLDAERSSTPKVDPGTDAHGAVTGAARENGPAPSSLESPTMPAPDDTHYATVLRYMVEQGSVVPVLGSGVRGSLPDAAPLAAHLAEKFGLTPASADLAAVAQRVLVAEGPSFLDRAMLEALTPQPEPDEVHRFLARFPARCKQLGLPENYQMIVTTNYDSTLEQAFHEAGEAYDLAVFLATGTDAGGTDKGKFLHVPWNDEPRVIGEPTTYRDFKIDRFDELQRTVIVKIQGAAEGGEGNYRWDRSYVLTEDQYIDYLVTDQIVRLVPNQILNKLTGSHCLFLGYPMQDWSRRVLLKRIWQGRPLNNRSWAVEHRPNAVERDSWKALQVELLARSPSDYARELDARLNAWPQATPN
jgi:hypothetical protein